VPVWSTSPAPPLQAPSGQGRVSGHPHATSLKMHLCWSGGACKPNASGTFWEGSNGRGAKCISPPGARYTRLPDGLGTLALCKEWAFYPSIRSYPSTESEWTGKYFFQVVPRWNTASSYTWDTMANPAQNMSPHGKMYPRFEGKRWYRGHEEGFLEPKWPRIPVFFSSNDIIPTRHQWCTWPGNPHLITSSFQTCRFFIPSWSTSTTAFTVDTVQHLYMNSMESKTVMAFFSEASTAHK